MTKRKLVLENGTEFIGDAFGSDEIRNGEMIFYTGMSGYQEMITDPSYVGKIVVMTYPSVGAYGINRDDFEAISPSIEGLIVKELCNLPVNFRSEETLEAFMKRHDIPGISGIDTRMLTKIIRDQGTVKGIITNVEATTQRDDFADVLSTKQLMEKVSVYKPYIIPGRQKRIVVMDLGVKQSILHELTELGCHITVVPYFYTKEDIDALKPDGILISNGPGNPEKMVETIKTIERLIGNFPMLGIGLGHQLIAMAYGANVRKLPVGQYGVNFPVTDVKQDKTWITTMNHNYVVDDTALPENLTVSHRSLNDGAIAGFRAAQDNVFGVQFHPEGAPGSNETKEVFAAFLQHIEMNQVENGGNQHA